MADEEQKQILRDVKGKFTSMERILKEFQADNKKKLEEQLKANKEFLESVDAVKGLSERDADKIKRAGMLEQSFGFTREAAIGIAETTKSLNLVTERMEQIEDFANQTGQDVQTSAEYKALELQKKSLEELQKYGKNLSGFERTFVKFAGGTFEDMKKSIEDGGKLTQQGIVSTLGDNLSSDFDRLLTFLGPIGGALQQIPFLGTILTFIGDQLKSVFVRLVLSAKERFIDGKKQNAIDTENLRIAKRGMKAQERATRDRYKTEQAGQVSGQTIAGGREEVQGGDVNIGSFGTASVFLGAAASIGGAAGAGLKAAAFGMMAFGKAAFVFAKALAIGGLALGVGLTGVFGSFALGEKMGAFEGMEAFGKVNMLKVLGSMLGLATLMGVLGAIVSTGVGALIMGVGALAVMALIGSLVVIGKGLGEFAESILPFEQMNVPRIKQNISQLASISSEITELMNMSGGRGIITQAFSEHPLTELANALGHYESDMSLAIKNLTSLKGALKDFKLPELPESELTFGAFFRGLFGEDFAGELESIAGISLTEDLGTKMGALGDGLGKIGDGLNKVTEDNVSRLERIGEVVKDLRGTNRSGGIEFNFNSPTPNLKPEDATQVPPQTISTVVSPTISNRSTNVTKRFNATGSNMGKHSALHYPSLG